MKKLRGTVDCGKVVPGTIECKATIGDLAIARMRTKDLEQRFVVGIVAAVGDDGHVKTIATSHRRPSWEYDAQVHVGDRKQLHGITVEQIALTLTRGFKNFADARHAILELVRQSEEAAPKTD